MTATLDVLILDDQPLDAELMAAELRRAGFDLAWERVDTEDEYLAGLNHEVDVILADYSMPGFGAMRALQLLHERELDIPFIVVTGALSDDIAVETVDAGADDYLLKDRLARLGPTVERVLQEKKAREEKRAAETALLVSETRARELAELSRVISSSDDIADVFSLFASHVKKLIPFDRIAISAVDRKREVLINRFAHGIDIAGTKPGYEIPLDEFAFRGAFERGESRVLSERDMITVADRYQHAAFGLEAGLKSTIFVPMRSGDQTFGMLALRSIADHAYSNQDLVLAEHIAAQIAGVVANDQLRRAAEEEARQHAVLAEIGRIVSSESSVDKVYPKFAEALRTLIRADRIVVQLLGDDRKTATNAYVDGVPGRHIPVGATFSIKDTTAGEVVITRSSVVLSSSNMAEMIERFPHLKDAIDVGLVSGISSPMISEDEVIAVLHVGTTEDDVYGPREIELVEEVAAQIAGAVANAQLHSATRREADERSVLAEISRLISSARDINDVYERFAECVGRVIPADRLVISLATPDDPSVWSDAYVSGRDLPGFRAGAHYAREASAAPLFDTHRTPAVFDQVTLAEMPVWEKNDQTARSVGLHSMMIAPLIWDDQVIGSINFRSALPDAYASDELAIAGRVADQIAGAIANTLARQKIELAHEQLETSEENYRDLVESSHDLIWRCDAEGRFTYLNPAWERTHGYTVDEMLGRPFTDFQTSEIADRDMSEFGRHLAGGSVIEYETCHIAKSGEEITLLFNAFPVTNADGEIIGTRGTARDITGERKLQAGLRVRAAVVEATGDAMIVEDTDGVITLANAAAEDMFGRGRDELIGSHISTLMPMEYRAGHSAALGRNDERSASQILGTLLESEGLRADGTRFPIELRLSPIAGDDSAAYVATIRDITERKSLEATVHARTEALAESDRRYRDLYDNAPDMYVSVDAATGKIVECNKTALIVFGYRRDELIGKPMVDLHHPDSLADASDLFRQFRETGVISDVELKYQRKDGTMFYASLSVSAVRDAEGNILRSRSTLRDVTERKKAEEELRIRVAALDAAAEMVVITDSQGTIEYVNRAFTRETGYEPDEVVGGTPRVLKSGRQDPDFYRDLWNTIKAGRVWSGTLINRRKDGSEYPEEMTVTPVIGDDGEVVRIIAIKRDISERLRAAAERETARDLEAENHELQRVNEARSQFLSTVSHELRTPLTAMLAFSEILRRNRQDNLTAQQLQQLGHISKGGRRLNELIEDLLDVSRSDAGRFKLELAPFDIRELIEEIARSCRSIFEERGQSLKVVNLPESTWIDGDRGRVMQVFNNLLTNAAKYSPDGTPVEMVATAEEDVVQVTVRDQGIGISQEDQEKLFVPFFRAENKETRSESGTGLGLVIVKTIVESHGGRIELESQRGVGTTVRTWLPGILHEPPEDLPDVNARPVISGSRLDELAD
ncbi:MAG: PAS domain S-box protein [Chloroflexi bacterium]|nr:PAS domain S-box protein [Chloroflexota bacterium]